MFAAESYTSRHYIAIVAMACLCVLLGGPTYAAGAESLIIAGATYFEPGVSGPGWAWTDAGHLELNGYAGDAIGADSDLVVTLSGHNSVTGSHAPDADITQCGMEVWGGLTLRGTGSLSASGSQCAIHVLRRVPAGRGRRPGRLQAFRRCLVARCDRCRWRCRMRGRVARVRTVRDACGRGLRHRRRGGCLRGHGAACGG